MHLDREPPTGHAARRRRGVAAVAAGREARLAESARRRKRRSDEDRERRRRRRVEDQKRREARRAEDREVGKQRKAEDKDVGRRRKAEDRKARKARKAERRQRKQQRKDERLQRQEQRRLRRAEQVELRELRRAEQEEQRKHERAEQATQQLKQEALRRARVAREQEQRTARQTELEEQRRLSEAVRREQDEQHRAQKVEQRERHAAAVASAREADAAARELLKQSKAEARRVQQLRKAEDAELRKRRKAEDAERRRAIATDERVRVRRKRRWTMWFGLGLLAVGFSLMGYIGWQLWGTNWVSHRKHERIVADVQEEWTVAASTTLTQDEPPTVDVPEGEVSGLIRIPEFGRDYVIPVLEGTSDEVLAAGFGHFSDSADPGEVGNYALAAHRVTHGEPLREMPSLDVGDEVIVETRDATYTYELTSGGDDLRVTFHDIWVIDDLPDNPDPGGVQPAQVSGQRLITLTTCAELFHTDDRLIAFGILTDTELHS